MSHFTVLVIGPDHDKQLAPFHEFECTGRDDEFVQDVDITEERRKEYEEDTGTRYRTPDGSLISAFDDDGEFKPEFLREPTQGELTKHGIRGRLLGSGGSGDGFRWISRDFEDGRGYRAKIMIDPEGYEKIELPMSELMTFAEYCTRHNSDHVVLAGQPVEITDNTRYGYVVLDAGGEVVKVIRRTNPNAAWDWYQVGGRWAGFFKMKPTATTGVKGERSWGMEKDGIQIKDDEADIIHKGDVDFEGMRCDAEIEALARYDKVHALINGRPVKSWEQVMEEFGEANISAARDAFHAQEVVKDLNASEDEDLRWVTFNGLDDYFLSREAYGQLARDRIVRTFAVVKDGQWYSRGHMGWWGAVHNEKDEKEWTQKFNELLDSLPDDTVLTVVDCHI